MNRLSIGHALRVGLCLAALGWTGCATILGTAFSPITGGVEFATDKKLTPLLIPDFAVGAVLGPFVAIYNGLRFDSRNVGSNRYGQDFHRVFRPFELLDRERARAAQTETADEG